MVFFFSLFYFFILLGTCLTYWGYNNTNSATTTISVGVDNEFIPSSITNQPTTFLKGIHNIVFTTFWNCSLGNITWTITTGQ